MLTIFYVKKLLVLYFLFLLFLFLISLLFVPNISKAKNALTYRVEQDCDINDFRNVENEFVVDGLSECRQSHEIDIRLFVSRQSKKDKESFPQNVAQYSSNIGI